jgi:predicted ATPase/DNA-binding SARP family transcriptional activator
MALTLGSEALSGAVGYNNQNAGQLPISLTPLVGRRQEVAELSRRLPENRLVTLLGPGGVGKTRLAMELARAAEERGQGEIRWVELAPVSANLVAGAVAEAVGGREAEEGSLGPLFEALASRNVLLVLDNAEHVVVVVASLCTELLRSCRGLRILATSREPLGVPGEVVWPVPPLKVPGTERGSGELANCEAVELFVERARAAFPGFEFNDGNAEAVSRICQRLDGLPLAIELAVASLRMLPVEEAARNLDDDFKLLVGGPRTSPARHQTLRAALDWSHHLLVADEKEILRRLSVFVGHFSLEAASRVAVPGGDGAAAYDVLRRLVDKSMVVAEVTGSQALFRLLATVREYARDQLHAAGEEDACRRAHLDWCVRRAGRAEPRLTGATQAVELERLETEVNDIRAALHFARDVGDAKAVLEVASALGRFWYLHGHYREGREWLDWAVVACPSAPGPLRAKALRTSGHLAFLQCEYAAAVRRLTAALRIYKSLKDPHGTAATLQVLGSVDREQGRYQQAERHHTESKALFEASDDRWGVASAHGYLGFAAWLQGDRARAREECGQALELFRGFGDAEGTAWSLLSLGVVAQYEGDLTSAEELLGQSRAISEAIGFREGIAWSFNQLGLVSLRQENSGAEVMLRASLEVHRVLGDQWRQTSVLEDLASAAMLSGHAAQAARLLGAAERARARIGTPIAACEQADHASTVASVRAALAGRDFEQAFQEGKNAALDDLLRRPSGPVPGARRIRASDSEPRGQSERAESDRKGPVGRVRTGAKATGEPKAATAALSIRALGAAELRVGDRSLEASDWGYSKPRELFFLLCSSPPRTRDQLGMALWPDLAESQLRNALHSALRDMRRALGDKEWVTFTDGRYSFNGARPHSCDVSDFEAALATARRMPGPQALPHLQRALAVYRGDFLEGLAGGEWAEERRRALRADYERVLGATGAILTKAGQLRQAVQIYERAVAHEPLDETSHRELMKCWARLGEPARALRHYDTLENLLRDQVGAPPAPETVRLYGKLRAGT